MARKIKKAPRRLLEKIRYPTCEILLSVPGEGVERGGGGEGTPIEKGQIASLLLLGVKKPDLVLLKVLGVKSSTAGDLAGY